MLTPSERTLLDQAPDRWARRWTARMKWRFDAHPGQIAPAGEWRGWLLRAGRGYGKTLAGAWDTAEHALDNPQWRIGIVAPTLGDVRDTCLEGETGLLAVLGDGSRTFAGMGLSPKEYTYNRSLLEVVFRNGSKVKGYGSEKPDRLRGPQHHRMWFDEVAAWSDAAKGNIMHTTYNNATLGLRLGSDARWVATSTPRYNPLIVHLDEHPRVVTTRGTTHDNIANLAVNFGEDLLGYEGTALERQELLGEIVEHVGQLFRQEWFTYYTSDGGDRIRMADGRKATLGHRYITCDPALSTKTSADWTVFVVWADAGPAHAVVDVVRARMEAPDVVATARRLCDRHEASWVGFEATSFQSALVQYALREGIPARKLKADRDKVSRAQPLIALLRAGQVVFPAGASWLPDLERELVQFPDGPYDDQVDALAYGVLGHRRTWALY